MRNPERIDQVLNTLRLYWKVNPDLRLGQIICNAARIAGFKDPFFVEDDIMKEAIQAGGASIGLARIGEEDDNIVRVVIDEGEPIDFKTDDEAVKYVLSKNRFLPEEAIRKHIEQLDLQPMKEDDHYIKDCWDQKSDELNELVFSQQRAERGYSDRDVWSIDIWFLNVIPKMLRDLAENSMGYQPLDENGDYLDMETAEQTDSEILRKRWKDMILKMAHLAEEANEDTCSRQNEYLDEWYSYHEKFDEKYPDKDILKTPDELEREKKEHVFVYIDPGRDPDVKKEYEKITEKMLNRETEIQEYRNQCKDAFFELFRKYFFCLWD